jgi:alkaline phosphatase
VKYLISLIVMIAATGFVKSEFRATLAQEPPKVKNIILLIGDGMGLSQISAALYNEKKIALERFSVIGFQKTTSANNLVTDSAAAATALACGKKTNNNAIGLDENGQPCATILEEAEKRGLATGLVVTSSIVHATPACFIAHQKSRNFYENIAADFLNTKIDLFIGGGKQFFDRRDNDERNLTRELEAQGMAVYDYFRDNIMKITPSPQKRFAFFTADNQPLPAFQGRDYLPRATRMSLEYLSQRSEKGFFLMVEGSQIDWSCHANQGEPLLNEMKDFDDAILQAFAFAKKDGQTLVIVTADHETGGVALNSGSQMKKLNLKFTTNGHTASMVPVFAYGPKAELFQGIYENTEIYFKMKEAFGF